MIIGERVVTRSGKRGTVVAINDDGSLAVRFDASGFTAPRLRPGQLVDERAYDQMIAPRQRQIHR